MRPRGAETRAVADNDPTAPPNSGGRPVTGTSSARKCTLSVRNSKLSSREKNEVDSGSE